MSTAADNRRNVSKEILFRTNAAKIIAIMKTTPREDIAERSAAKLMLAQLVRSAVAILNDELDGLMPQFKAANPNFYEAYFAARTIVDARGGQAEPDKEKVASVPSPTPLAKAA
jgi:hypothetical protein